ncbi:hypothetical protein [Streptomyces sp. NPDC059828]|uniref:hypothetical protein n=1 Tax=Streptomyces sp. NPDC059828 TaxID=3346965 RepID=UPI003650FC11
MESKPYLDQRWQEGCTNAWKLWEEIKEQGYPRGYGSVRDYVSGTLRGKTQPVGPRPTSARAVTRWVLTHPEALPEGDRLPLKVALTNCPELAALAEHVRSFARILTHLQGDRLPEWIEAANANSELPSLHHFAQHLIRDLDAVTAGLSHQWNSGVVEATSTGSRCCSARCSVARDSNSSANEFYWRDRASPDHRQWTRARSHAHNQRPADRTVP